MTLLSYWLRLCSVVFLRAFTVFSCHWFISGLPAVITMTAFVPDTTLDDIPFPEALRRLEEAGAAVVGLNCSRGPSTMMPLLKDIRAVCQVNTLKEIISQTD